jgi:hypothetical protein
VVASVGTVPKSRCGSNPGYSRDRVFVRADGFIARAELGDAWPFTVDSGVLSCDNGAIIFTSGTVAYGVNGLAKSRGHRRIEEIWKWRDGIAARMDLTPIFERGQQRCR